MNWSQKLLLIRFVAIAGLVLSIGGCFAGVGNDNSTVISISAVAALVFLVIAVTAKFVARIVFGWHKAGSVGGGHRVWHD